ncbi:hypothetical protein A6R68_02626, partial [Neotoma lepida]
SPPGSNFFSGTKRGVLFLTSYRVIFVNSRSDNNPMLSFMMPFHLMSNCTVEQPIFGANYIKGTIQAALDGGWEGSATFKMVFRRGGAVDFAQLMAKAAYAAAQGFPLRVSSFWMHPLRILVISGERSMHAPQAYQGEVWREGHVCPTGVPSYSLLTGSHFFPFFMPFPVAYGAPPSGHGAPPSGHGAPPAGRGAPPAGYRAPPPSYDVLPPGSGARGYGSPPPVYGAIPMSYEVLPPGYYEASTMQYGAPPPRYETSAVRSGSPPPEREAPPMGYATPPSGYRSIPPLSRAPPTAHEAPPAGSEAGHPIFKDLKP